MIPALVGVVAVPVTGNAGQGPDHDYATSSVIVFAVAVAIWAGVTIVNAAAPCDAAVRRRVTVTALAAGSVAVLYGLLLLALRAGDLILRVRPARPVRRRGPGRRTRGWRVRTARAARHPLSAQVAGAMAVPAALSPDGDSDSARLLATEPSIWDVLLGYELPGAPTALRLATFWRFDTFLGFWA